MANQNDNDWAVVHRVIEAEKAHAWERMERLVQAIERPGHRRPLLPIRLGAAAAVILAITVTLFITLRPRGEALTLDQLPFFATAKAGHPSTGVSPREREMGRRLDGWMALARQKPLSDLPPTGKMEQNNPGETRNSKSITIRETMLERLFLESDKHQEV